MNKKGAELTLGTIIIAVLGVIVLAVLAIGLTGTWKNFWGSSTAFAGSGEDVQTVLDACNVACAKQSVYDFCKKQWKVKEGKETKLYGCTKLFENNAMGNCDNLCSGVEGVFTEEVKNDTTSTANV